VATRVQAPGGAAPQSDTLVSSSVLTRSPLTSDEFEVDGLEGRSPTPSEFSTSAFQENFAGVPVSSGAMPLVQPKLVVGPANDKYEQEADRVADQVMGMSEPGGLPTPQPAPGLQRQSIESESMPDLDDDDELVQTKALGPPPSISQVLGADHQLQREPLDDLDDDDELVQMKPAGAATAIASPTLTSQLGQGGGHPLPSSTRHFMETRFGADFSQVQAHTDADAMQMSQNLKAQAFTSGQHIYFGAGQYQPHSAKGQHLLAHELAHTIQQGASKTHISQSKPSSSVPVSQPTDASEQEAETVANRVVTGHSLSPNALSSIGTTNSHLIARRAAADIPATPSDISKKAPSDRISLVTATFEPSAAISDYLETQGRHGGAVNVQLGNLAAGTIPVRKSGETYQTPGRGNAAYKPVPLMHRALQPLRSAGVEPVLAVRVQNNAIDGYITLARNQTVAGNQAALPNWVKDHAQEMGWLGFDISRIPRVENKLQAGALSLQMTDFPVRVGGFINGTASFGLSNETTTFSASGNISVPHLTDTQISIEQDAAGNLNGNTDIPVQIANFSGQVIAQFHNGTLDIRGTVGYQAEKFSGEVTLLVTDRETARNVAKNELSPDAITDSAAQASGVTADPQPGPRAIAGFGNLNFAFTEWMTGQAQVIIDNEGHITVVGEIAPPAEIELFPQRDYIYDIFSIEVRTLYGVPLVGNVFVFANVGMQALAKLGPGKIYNIAIIGRYSTDPDVLQNFEMEATLNISAFAGLRMRAEGGVGVQLMKHDIKTGVGLDGLAGVQGYVEATPTIGYRETADPQEGRQGEYFIKGHMEIAAQPFLGLGGDLFVELDSPWWSPAPNKKWTWPLFDLEYPLPGEFGIGADVDYVIGSGELPEIQFGEVNFDSSKFMTDLMNDHVPPKSQGEQETAGEWQEDQAEGAAADPTVTAQTTSPSDDPASPRRLGDEPVPASPQEAQNRMGGMEALAQLVDRSQGQPLTEAQFTSAISSLRSRYRFSRLDIERRDEDWYVRAAMSDPVDFTVQGTEQNEVEERFGEGPHAGAMRIEEGPPFGTTDERHGEVAEETPSSTPIPPRLDGQDLQRIEQGQVLNLTQFRNTFGPQFPERMLPPGFRPPNDPQGRTNRERSKAGLSAVLLSGERVELHHVDQDFFSRLDEMSAGFHRSVHDDPEYHPYTDDPGYASWRNEPAFYYGRIRTLGYIYNNIRRRYWRNRFR